MLLGKRTRKVVAATFLTILVTNIFAPGVSYALTSGPTQPEASSFEPIDTTDMVNMQTGDMTYNIPLIEVPGPDGGYPLSLSYHAGIQPNEDASWVGLGWTLNPGAITRSVNGFPDDWYTPSTNRRDFWQGGSTNSFSIGVSVGIAETPATVSFGLSFSQDTYRGFGVGLDLGVGYRLGGDDSPFGASIGVGISPYGDAYMSGGVGATVFNKGGVNGSVGIGFQTNFQTVNAGFTAGVGYSLGHNAQKQSMGGSMLGISLNTGSSKPSLSLGGLSGSVSNDKAGNITTHSSGFHIDIPVYYGINVSLGFNKTRYMSDESVNINTHGSLFPNGWGGTGNQYGGILDNVAYDEYSLLEDASYKNIVDNPDPTKVQGGAFPDFDVYSVNAQGLGGNMRPYLLQGTVVAQNNNNGSTPVVTYCSPGVTDNTPVYRFVNDFSNSYRQSYSTFSDPSFNLRFLAPPFDANPVYGNNDGSYGYSGGNDLAGSKYVSTSIKVRPRNPRGYVPGQRLQSFMIEGYSITNESGMTYHFGLPAYSYGEENYQEKLNGRSPLTFTRSTRATPYAYTWYLTTVTGPDYVDRNGNGIADDGDWGYWIDYEYGKANDAYIWRNPSEGYQKDEDNQFENVSMGYKEVYYLNAIRTRTHVALFEKQTRMDAKGGSTDDFGKVNNSYYAVDGYFDGTSAQSEELSHIYLLNASDENSVGFGAGFSPNTLDKEDVDAVGRAALEAKCLKVIDFNYNYSLCPNTTNSFDLATHLVKSGKLTLTSVVTRGQGGVNLLPATQFAYELTGSDANLQTGVSLSPGSFTTTNGNFKVGDMIMQQGGSNLYCGVITNVSPSGTQYTYTLANNTYTGGAITADVYKTKNPPYNKDAYDSWGLYKSDYSLSQISADENAGRQTTPVSAAGTDAWSLRRVTTPLGGIIQVGYEPDQYSKAILSTDYAYIISSASKDGPDGTFTKVAFKMNTQGYSVSSLLSNGSQGKMILIADYHNANPGDSNPLEIFPTFTASYTVTNIDGDGTVHADLSILIPQTQDYGAPGGPYEFIGFSTGNISASNSGSYGGGTRVNKVTMSDITGYASSVSYDYSGASGFSSGVTSYAPTILPLYDQVTVANTVGETPYKRLLYADVSNLYSIARELPPPGVMYEYVMVTSQIQNADESTPRDIPGATQYQFEVYRPNMVGRVDIPGTSSYTTTTGRTLASTSYGTMNTHNLAIMRYTGGIGNVKRVTQYDKKTSDRKILSETINHYLDEGLENLSLTDFRTQYQARLAKYYYQGFIQERFSETKVVGEQGYTPASQVMLTLSAREEYPAIQTGQTVINYVNGTQTTSQNLGFDFYSGAVTQTQETDAYGNSFVTQKIPAYRQYPAMGLAAMNTSNKNMLTQTAETYMWKVDPSNPVTHLGLVSASVTTWGHGVPVLGTDGSSFIQNVLANGDIWREQSTYNWQPAGQTSDGLTPTGSFTDFNWSNPGASAAGWIKNSEITLYDVYSKALEATDINGNYAATRLNYGEQKVILTGGPANYYEIAYSGAEDAALSQTGAIFVKAADGTASTAAAHTGAQSLLLAPAGKKGFSYSVPIVSSGTNGVVAGRNYTAAVWVKPVSGTAQDVKLYYSVGGTVKGNSASSGATGAKTAGGWTLINLYINGSDLTSGTLNVYCQNDHASASAYVDDMRFQPLNASTTAYVYDPFNGALTHILDNSNLYTRFEYDAAGRLVRTYKEKLNTGTFTSQEFKTNQYAYNYGATKFTNAAITNVAYAKNNCQVSAGYVGSNVFVTIPDATYTSFISQPDADAQAQIYAQDYANTHGSCICSPTFTFDPAVNSRSFYFGPSGTRINFNFGFIYPTGSTFFKLGNIKGSCICPAAMRTIPITAGSCVYNVTVYPDGTVNVSLVSGTPPTSGFSLSGVYDQQIDLQYSDAMSGYGTTSCPSGYQSTQVPVTIAAYAYAAADKTTANSLANAALITAEQAAGQSATCVRLCSFTWASAITNPYSYTVTAPSTTLNFNFTFQAPSSTGFTQGTLGTIGSSCVPSGQRLVSVHEGNNTNRVWDVTITQAGVVSIRLTSGTAPTNNNHPVQIVGSVSL